MDQNINRRDFLKLIALTPLLSVKGPKVKLDDSTQDESNPSVFVLVFDALSASHLSLLGYHRQTTPNIDRFAEKATVYHHHYAGGNFTSPGTASLLTGTYPWTNRAFHMHGTVSATYEKRNLFSLLPSEIFKFSYSHNLLVTSLLHQFSEHIDEFTKTRELCLSDDQYSDILFNEDFNASFWSEWLIMRGGETKPSSIFVSLLQRMLRLVHKREATQNYGSQFPQGIPNLHNLLFVLEHAIDWIMDELTASPKPFFGYVHLLPPHEPYTTRKDFINIFNDDWSPPAKPSHHFTEGFSEKKIIKERKAYDEYLAYADAEFGRLYDFMEKEGVLENAYVIFTSDHGELFERGIRGHVTPVLYNPVIRVPLLISKPGQQQREDIFVPTSHVDLLPTILHLYKQSKPEWCEGSVLPTFNGSDIKQDRSVFSMESKGNPKQAPITKGTLAIVKEDYKLIKFMGYDGYEDEYELYNLSKDHEEMDNVYTSEKTIATELKMELNKKLDAKNQPYRRS